MMFQVGWCEDFRNFQEIKIIVLMGPGIQLLMPIKIPPILTSPDRPTKMASAPSLTDAASLRVDALLNGPAGIPPPGVLSDFVNPPNLDTRVYIAITVGITFASLAVLIRIYTRIFLLRSVGYDDCE